METSYKPEDKIRILKDLKRECQTHKVLEDSMREAGKTSSEAEAALKSPIKEQIDAYNAMKYNLEKLCSKVMQDSQIKVCVFIGDALYNCMIFQIK